MRSSGITTHSASGEHVLLIVDPTKRLDPARELRRLPLPVTKVVQIEVAASASGSFYVRARAGDEPDEELVADELANKRPRGGALCALRWPAPRRFTR